MKYSNTALKNLSARYGKILRKCAYLNAIILTAAMIANPAMAENIASGTTKSINNQTISQQRSDLDGGSFYNEGSLTVSDSTFTQNNAKIADKMYGGAIFSKGSELTINDSKFSGNTAFSGGAIYESMNSTGKMTITNTEFSNNQVIDHAGALGIFKDGTLTNVQFYNNSTVTTLDDVTTKSADGGGAIHVGGTANASLTDVTFKGNSSVKRGGAIAARHGVGYTVNISDSLFDTNSSGNFGGGIATVYGGTINVNTTDFINNSATKAGGAIYNGIDTNYGSNADNGGVQSTNHGTLNISGTNNFTGNTAGEFGGAIYSGGGTINLSGKNVFSGNKAGGVANDIHNLGTLNISGDLTLDGGITGTGSVVFEKGSTLKTALNNFTSLISGNTVTGTTSLVIDNGTTNATLNMFDASQSGFTFANNTLYDIIEDKTTAGTYNISKKSTEAIAESLTSAGADTTAAQTVAAMTEAKPTTPAAAAIANAITTAAQTGDTAALAELTEKVNPTTTPVVQQQSVAMANQIFSVAGGRMGGIGRSGGDVNVTVGPWIQGLYNKTHNSQGVGFDGYSQGFALGLDADINEHSLIGFGYGYTATDVKSNGRKTQIYSDNIFLYGKYQPNKWYVSGIANYGHSNYKETSLGLIGKYNVDTYSAAANVGYQSGLFDNYAGLRYSYITPDSYSNGLTTVDSKNSQIGTAVIGTKISKSYKTENATWKPEIRLAATYDIKSDNSSSIVGIVGGSSTYMVEGKRQKRFAVEAGAGITATVARNLDISFNYDANLRSEQTSQTGSVKLKYSF